MEDQIVLANRRSQERRGGEVESLVVSGEEKVKEFPLPKVTSTSAKACPPCWSSTHSTAAPFESGAKPAIIIISQLILNLPTKLL